MIPNYGHAMSFHNGLARWPVNGGWGFVDTWPHVAIPGPYVYVRDFRNGFAPVEVSPGKWGFIDTQGNLVASAVFDCVRDFCNGFAPVRICRDWGFVDTSGTLVVRPAFQDVRSFRNGLAKVKCHGMWGFIDTCGTILGGSFYDGISGDLTGGLAGIRVGNYWGAINVNGIRVLRPLYDDVWPLGYGFGRVRHRGLFGVIDAGGALIIPIVSIDVGSFLSNGVLEFEMYGQQHHMDTNGRRL
jgi:hypothetical protein